MTRMVLILSLLLAMPAAAQAECYVHYKAKQDSPLRLHYGILALGSAACPGPAAATRNAESRLQAAGWTLLNIVALSTDPPGAEQRANAGAYYLRF